MTFGWYILIWKSALQPTSESGLWQTLGSGVRSTQLIGASNNKKSSLRSSLNKVCLAPLPKVGLNPLSTTPLFDNRMLQRNGDLECQNSGMPNFLECRFLRAACGIVKRWVCNKVLVAVQPSHLTEAKALRPRAHLNLPAAFSSYFTTRSSG